MGMSEPSLIQMKLTPSLFNTKSSRNAPRAILLASVAGLLSTTLPVQAEVAYEAWRTTFDNTVQAGQSGNATATDSRGNVIVTGFTAVPGGNKSIYTAKYSVSDGSVVWQKTFSAAADAIGNSVAVDSQDNVIVTGRATGVVGGANYCTVKYSKDGVQLWEREYGGPQGGADEATKVIVDHHDNVVVTGTSYGGSSQEDWFTIKYAAGDGAPLWGGNAGGVRFNGIGNQKDVPAAMVVDSSDNVLVAGRVIGLGGKTSYQVLKYVAANGSLLGGFAPNPNTPGDNEATAIAIDQSNRVVVTGIARAADNSRSGYTAAYDANANFLWDAAYDAGVGNYSGGPTGVAIDRDGGVIVTGTSKDSDVFGTAHIKTVKYNGIGSFIPNIPVWQSLSPSADHTDVSIGLVLDDAGNVVITGTSNDVENHAADYYTAKYDSQTGKLVSEFRYDGAGGQDTPHGLAVDHYGNVAIVGTSSLFYTNTNVRYDRICTVRYNRLRVAVGDGAPTAGVFNSGIPAGATIGSVSVPALADDGALAVKVTIVSGKTHRNAILTQGASGDTRILALQGQPAAGTGGGTYATFLDPVIAPDGNVAFTGKLSGVSAPQSTGVWAIYQGGLLRRMQTGMQLPNAPAGVLLKSVAAISYRNLDLVAQVQVSGTGVTAANSSVLYGYHAVFGGKVILRTGDPITAGNSPASAIKSINAFLPAKGSTGQGRTFSANLLSVKVGLADKRTVLLSVNPVLGSSTPFLYQGEDTTLTPVNNGTVQTLGTPAIGSENANYVAAGTFLRRTAAGLYGTVTASSDEALFFSATGQSIKLIAREGDPAPMTSGLKFGSFQDPFVNNQGDAAFVSTLTGAGVSAATKTALWWGTGSDISTYEIVARQGAAATDAAGAVSGTSPKYGAFLSTALPGGSESGPVYVAKLSGAGVSVKNNLGLWAVDSTGLVRRLLRTGDSVGALKVTAFTALTSSSGSLSVTRSFNETGGVDALVSFSDHTKAVMHLAIP